LIKKTDPNFNKRLDAVIGVIKSLKTHKFRGASGGGIIKGKDAQVFWQFLRMYKSYRLAFSEFQRQADGIGVKTKKFKMISQEYAKRYCIDGLMVDPDDPIFPKDFKFRNPCVVRVKSGATTSDTFASDIDLKNILVLAIQPTADVKLILGAVESQIKEFSKDKIILKNIDGINSRVELIHAMACGLFKYEFGLRNTEIKEIYPSIFGNGHSNVQNKQIKERQQYFARYARKAHIVFFEKIR
jgi:hypothetical protein